MLEFSLAILSSAITVGLLCDTATNMPTLRHSNFATAA
jgi:hypothetical protein